MLCNIQMSGILVEGLGTLLDGIMGTGNGTTSTSINVGVIGITKVGCPVTYNGHHELLHFVSG